MRRLCYWLVVAIVAAAVSVPAAGHAQAATNRRSPAPAAVTVMSYNHGYAKTGSDPLKASWAERVPVIAAWVRHEDPDVIGFQENHFDYNGKRQDRKLAAALTEYQFIELDQKTPIAVKKSRFAVLDHGWFASSRKGTSGSHYNRNTTWAKLRDRKTDTLFMLFNQWSEPHQTRRAAEVRSGQVKRLLAGVAKLNPDAKIPFVITGDFNAFDTDRPGQAPVFFDHQRLMKAAGLVDSARVAAKDASVVEDLASYNGWGEQVNGSFRYGAVKQALKRAGGYHYDYIWTKQGQLKVAWWKIATGPRLVTKTVGGTGYTAYPGEVMPSDHLPVVARLILPTRPQATPAPKPVPALAPWLRAV